MKRPIYETLRALILGAICGTLMAIPLCLTVYYLGPDGFYALCFLVGLGAFVVANVLDRRARRASNGDKTK
jgi:uncharacterized membrane protein YccC